MSWSLEWNSKLKTLLCLSILIRIPVFYLSYKANPERYVPLEGNTYYDAGVDGYLQLARTFLKTGRFAFDSTLPPTNARPLLPPFLFALFVAWNPKSWYINLFLFNLTLWIVMSLLFAHFLRNQIGCHPLKTFAFIFLYFHPSFLLLVRTYTFLPLATTLFLSYFFAIFHLLQKKRMLKWHLISSILLALLILTHRSLLLLPFLHLCLLWFLLRREKQSFSWNVLPLYSIPFLVITGLALRNWILFQKILPIYSGAGIVYWMSEQTLYDKPDLELLKYQEITGKELKTLYFTTLKPEDDDILFKSAVDTILTDPLHFADRFAKGLLLFWAPTDQGTFKTLSLAIHNFLLLLLLFLLYKKRRFQFYDYEIIFHIVLVFHLDFIWFFRTECLLFCPLSSSSIPYSPPAAQRTLLQSG
jgi:hypothetical protein